MAPPRRGASDSARAARPRRFALAALAFQLASCLVDESGRYREGNDLSSLAPPEPSAEDRTAAEGLAAQPPEKLFRLLAYELFREDARPAEKRFGIRSFQLATEAPCPERLADMAQSAQTLFDEMTTYHLNITGTAGLYWLLHKYPEEHSWVWVIAASQERTMRKVGNHFTRMAAVALDDYDNCISPGFRTVLMNAANTWRRLRGDYIALLWNGVAFGLLGDVTSWREVDEEGQVANEAGGPPPNVSWSENLIFGNMWMSSVQKWSEHHAREIGEAAYMELARAQAGIPPDPKEGSWREGKDGVLSSFDYLHRQLFAGWPLDKGLLRGVLRHCLELSYSGEPPSVGDFGAGGGRYSEWLNDTGLVASYAFDGSTSAGEVTGQRVQYVDFSAPVQLWRKFDWVLCLDVLGQVPVEKAKAILQNIKTHALKGVVLSWAAPGNKLDEEVQALVEAETGLRLDSESTTLLREGSESKANSKVLVFRRP